MKTKMTPLYTCAILVLATSLVAQAEPIYLSSSYETLYRVMSTGEIESYDMGIKIRGMHYDQAADIVAVLADEGGSGITDVYLMANFASGTPSLTPYANLSHQYGGFTQINGTYYAFSSGVLYTLNLDDPANPIETYIGTTGIPDSGGAAYDPAHNTLYMTSYYSDALHVVDPETAAATQIGSGFGVDSDGLGAEWFDNQLYIANQNITSGNVEIGLVDVETGVYSQRVTLSAGASSQATALTIIPEPQMLGMIMMAGGALLRRRR